MQVRHIQANQRRLYVREAGSGPAVLLIHGLPSNGELWRDLVPRLAPRSRVIVPDLLGFGRSDPPAGRRVDLPAHADDLLRLLDQLSVRCATVVGHDIGGGVAQLLATRHSERVERMMLVDAVCYDAWPVPEMRALQLAAPVVERMPAGLTTRGIEAGLRRGFLNQQRAELFLDAFLQPFSTDEGLKAFVEHLRALDSHPTQEVAPLLRELRMPVAVAWGRHDPFLPPELAERLAGDIPTAELTWVEASHFAPADAPDAVAAALERLMER